MEAISSAMCPQSSMNKSVASYNLVFDEQVERRVSKRCIPKYYLAAPPPRGCENTWSRLFKSGVLYFEGIKILPNTNWAIGGKWTLTALSVTTQFKSILARRWLTVVAPQAARSKSIMMQSFPSFPMH